MNLSELSRYLFGLVSFEERNSGLVAPTQVDVNEEQGDGVNLHLLLEVKSKGVLPARDSSIKFLGFSLPVQCFLRCCSYH